MVTIKFTRSGVSGISRRLLQSVGRAAAFATALYWAQNYLPIHFTKRAIRRYGYAPRSGEPGSGKAFKGSYSEAKLKRRSNGDGVQAIGEVKPFVWSGRSREKALSGANVTAVARNYQSYEGRIAIPTDTLNYLRGRINADVELRAVSREEAAQLEVIFGDTYEAELNKLGRTNSVTKTIAA